MKENVDLDKWLAAEAGRLRELARSMVQDHAVADDVVQDVLVKRLEDPSGRDGKGRVPVIRRLASRISNSRREEGRRRAREQEFARRRQQSDPDTARLVSEAEAAELLMRHVMALPEGHRAVLLLFYFEGRSSEQIGSDLGISKEAVRVRLLRARNALRDRLDTQGGGRMNWLPMILVLAGQQSEARDTVWTTTGGIMGAKALASIALVAGLGLFAIGPWGSGSGETAMDDSRGPMESKVVDLAQGSVLAQPEIASRTRQSPPKQTSEGETIKSPAPLETQVMVLAGRVVVGTGKGRLAPVEGARVRVLSTSTLGELAVDSSAQTPESTTISDGHFHFALSASSFGAIEISYPGFATTHREIRGEWPWSGLIDEEDLNEDFGDIELEKAYLITGRVEDSAGNAIADVEIRSSAPHGLGELYRSNAFARHCEPLFRTDKEGRFSIDDLPVTTSSLVATHPHYIRGYLDLGTESDGLLVVLQKGATIKGSVPNLAEGRGQRVFACAWPIGSVHSPENGVFSYCPVGEDGAFELGGLAKRQTYEVQVLSGAFPGPSSEPVSLVALGVAGGDALSVPLRSGAEVIFRVVDETGKAIGKGLEVGCQFVEEQADVSSGFSFDYTHYLFRTPAYANPWENGRVQLQRLVPNHEGDWLRLIIDAPGRKRLAKFVGPVEAGARLDLGSLAMQKAQVSRPATKASIMVQLLDEKGHPVKDAQVVRYGVWRDSSDMLSRGLSNPSPKAEGETDPEGKAMFTGLKSGTHAFRVALASGVHARALANLDTGRQRGGDIPWATLEVVEGVPSTSTLHVTCPSRAQVSGVLRSDLGAVAGSYLALVDPHDFGLIDQVGNGCLEAVQGSGQGDPWKTCIQADERGQFSFDQVPFGTWLVVVAIPGQSRSFEKLVHVDSSHCELALDVHAQHATGFVVDRQGNPIPGVGVSFERGLEPGSGVENLHGIIWTRDYKRKKARLAPHPSPLSVNKAKVQTLADGSFTIPLSSWSATSGLVFEHEKYATRFFPIKGMPTDSNSSRFDCGPLTLLPHGRIEVLLNSQTNVRSVSFKWLPANIHGNVGDWETSALYGPHGFVCERVPMGSVQVTAEMDNGGIVDLGVTSVRAGQTSIVELDVR